MMHRDGDAPGRMTVYKKGGTQDYVQPKSHRSKSSKKKSNGTKNEMLQPSQSQSEPLEAENSQGNAGAAPPKPDNPHIAMTQNAVRRKQRFVNLYSQEGHARDVVLLPGRHPCECQAHRHALINNCIRCGRIVCRQEGSGPCFTCSNLVCTNEEMEILSHDSKKSQQLRSKLMSPAADENLAKAIEHKNRLLEYNRTSERRTKVIDDNSDYYSSDNKWLTTEQRELIRKKEEELRAEQHASRRQQKVTLDFAGRQVVKEEPQHSNIQSLLQALVKPMMEVDMNKQACKEVEAMHFVDPALDMPPPEYVPSGSLRSTKPTRLLAESNLVATAADGQVLGSRIQDRALMEMSDDGFALSVHQPYASLIVAGVKQHEGRAWFTNYRGRLWIHAASKPPTQEDINEVVEIYRRINEGAGRRPFPATYPTGCLLGCINLVECIPQDTYREQFPFGECFSPFVFICEDPLELKVKFPMKGNHKIFKMERRLHEAAKKTLLCPQILDK